MLISKYGFTDVLEPRLVVLDPSRVAAQIVTGVGFLGAGLIFVRRDSVRGLTTAAAIWVTAAIGAASGGGLPLLAILATGVYFLVAVAFPLATRRLPKSATAISALRVRYPDGQGILRDVLREATARGFAIDDIATELIGGQRAPSGQDGARPQRPLVEVRLHVHGRNSVNELAVALSELQDVNAVLASDATPPTSNRQSENKRLTAAPAWPWSGFWTGSPTAARPTPPPATSPAPAIQALARITLRGVLGPDQQPLLP
jgi:putative Mg2+ transporter-C (MgtC) family protein